LLKFGTDEAHQRLGAKAVKGNSCFGSTETSVGKQLQCQALLCPETAVFERAPASDAIDERLIH
jgi:hypothetical protein